MLKRVLKHALDRRGYGVYLRTPTNDPTLQLVQTLRHFGVDLVFDIGANVGQFAKGLRQAGFKGEIVSLEPLSSAHAALVDAASSDPRWTVHERCALGDRDGETIINISNNSVSSSVLPMMDVHRTAAPMSQYIGREWVPLRRFDTLAPTYLGTPRCPFLKIDTQGSEWQILDGAHETLPHLKGIQCEISLATLYDGSRSWREIIERIEAAGFRLWALQKGFIDPNTGRSLQMDAVFFRGMIHD